MTVEDLLSSSEIKVSSDKSIFRFTYGENLVRVASLPISKRWNCCVSINKSKYLNFKIYECK